jgi:hypothetical protein
MLFTFGTITDTHRVADVLDAYLVDRDLACIGTALYVGNFA